MANPTGHPPETSALIERAMRDMREYQLHLVRDAGSGHVALRGLGHVLVPTQVMARELPRVLGELLDEATTGILLYQVGFLTGRAQAEAFFAERGVGEDELLYRVLTGPFHFAWAGYGDVDILLLETGAPERFVALWETRDSFSAREGLAVGERRRTCHVQSGYSAGWLSAATGLPLGAHELACRTEGVAHCRFLVAHEEALGRCLSEMRFHLPRGRYAVIPARAPRALRLEDAPGRDGRPDDDGGSGPAGDHPVLRLL